MAKLCSSNPLGSIVPSHRLCFADPCFEGLCQCYLVTCYLRSKFNLSTPHGMLGCDSANDISIFWRSEVARKQWPLSCFASCSCWESPQGIFFWPWYLELVQFVHTFWSQLWSASKIPTPDASMPPSPTHSSIPKNSSKLLMSQPQPSCPFLPHLRHPMS